MKTVIILDGNGSKKFMVDDFSLVMKVKETGDNSAMQQLINSHSGIYLSVLDRSLPEEKFPVQKDDLRRDKDTQIYLAAMSYKVDSQMKFSTYLGQTIKWKCATLKSRGPDKDTVSLDAFDQPLPEKEQDFLAGEKKIKIEQIFEFAEKYPNEVARNIINLRYNSDKRMPWKQVAARLDISPSWAGILHAQFIKDAQNFFTTQQ